MGETFKRMKIRLKKEIVSMGKENINPGQGTDGSTYPQNHMISVADRGYFDYDLSNDIQKIIKSEFTEL